MSGLGLLKKESNSSKKRSNKKDKVGKKEKKEGNSESTSDKHNHSKKKKQSKKSKSNNNSDTATTGTPTTAPASKQISTATTVDNPKKKRSNKKKNRKRGAKKKKSQKTGEEESNDSNGKKSSLDSYKKKDVWYNKPAARVIKTDKVRDPLKRTNTNAVEQARMKAQEFLDRAAADETTNGVSDSDQSWANKVLSSGTLSDKVATMTLMIQESPIHKHQMMDQLLNMARKKGRREAGLAMEALKDLFISDLLPSRALLAFHERAHNTNPSTEQLVYWLLEDYIKAKYAEFVESLEEGTHDTMLYVKRKCCQMLADLLCAKPEAEQVILRLLVNKLGDPERKLGSKITFLLQQVLEQHPGMKLVVVKEVEALIFRSNVSDRAKYFCVIFLTQLVFQNTEEDAKLAQSLITVYFTLFRNFVEKNQGPKPTKGKLKNRKRNKGKKANEESDAIKEAQQKSMNSKLLSALLTGVNRAFPYATIDDSVFDEQTDLLFRVVHHSTFNTSVQALMLLYQVMSSRAAVSDRFFRALYEKLLSPELTTSSKLSMFLNIVFKALKNDISTDRVAAFIKRLLQVSMFQLPPFVCGVLFLISEILKHHPVLKFLISDTEDNDDEEEHFEDIDEDPETSVDGGNDREQGNDGASSDSNDIKKKSDTEYDPASRDPRYANARQSCLWELIKFTRHFHPSVVKFTQLLLEGQSIEYSGDPLVDFTHIQFLDRFVHRNPKKQNLLRKDILAAKLARKRFSSSGANEDKKIMDTNSLIQRDQEDVPADEMFFYRYYKEKKVRDEKDPKKKKYNSDDDSDSDEYADRLMEAEIRRLGGGMDPDMDDIDDFSMSEDDDDDKLVMTNTIPGADDSDSDGDSDVATFVDDDDDSEVVFDDDDEDGALDMLNADSDDGMDDFADDDDDDDNGGRSGADSVFASSEEFADILEAAGTDGANPKLREWQKRAEKYGVKPGKKRKGNSNGGVKRGGKGRGRKKARR